MGRQNIDLSTITRDKLHSLLSVARDEWKNYDKCREEVEGCEKLIEEEKKNVNQPQNGCLGLITIFMWICIFSVIVLVIMYLKGEEGPDAGGGWVSLGVMAVCAVISFIITFFSSIARKRNKKAAQENIKKYETQLSVLQQKKKEAMNEFDKVYYIPDDYCYEYALAKMLRYIDNYQAHSWKEVTALYDRYIHEKTVEDNTRISAEEAREQTELAKQTRNAARAAAAGTWVTASRR